MPPLGTRTDVQAAVTARLDVVEQRLRDVVVASHPLLSSASGHLVQAGGKRFRPMLALLAGHLGDPDRPEVVEAAVVVQHGTRVRAVALRLVGQDGKWRVSALQVG